MSHLCLQLPCKDVAPLPRSLYRNIKVLQLMVLAASEAVFFQHEEDAVFSYQAIVTNTVVNPAPFTLEYMINAKIHIWQQEDKNTSLFSLHNIDFIQMFEMPNNHVTNMIENITYEAENLKLPVEIHYFEDGTIDYINVEKIDSTWSINFKKGIILLFQLNYKNIYSNKYDTHSFTSREPTLTGECNVMHQVESQEEGNLKVTKTFENCEDKWTVHSTLISRGFCELPLNDIVTTDKYRVYYLDDENVRLNKIESYWNVIFYPIIGKGGTHSVQVNQIIQKLSNNDTEFEEKINKDKINTKVNIDDQNIADLSKFYNLPYCNLDHLQNLLMQMVEYMRNGHITLQEPDWKQTNLYYSLINSLRAINIECFDLLMKHMNTTTSPHFTESYNLFLSIIPFIGTHSSTVFIHDAIKQQRINDLLAKTYYKEMPFYIMFPSKELLEQLSDILLWGKSMNKHVQISALLAFSTVLSKSEPLDAAPYIQKIIDEYINCQNYECKLIYISALQNSETNKIIEILEPVITNISENKTVSPDLRNIAMWATLPQYMKNPKKIQQIYWPILCNIEEPLQLRISALKILLTETSMNNLLKLKNLMESEKNEHIYNIFYSTLSSLARSVTPCYKTSRERARSILQYIKRTAHSSYESFSDIYDYYDKTYNMGAITKISVAGSFFNHKTVTVYIQFTSHLSNMMADQYSFYIKLRVNEHIKETIKSTLKTVDINNLMNLKNIIHDLEKVDPEQASGFHVEIMVLKLNKITECKVYNELRIFIGDLMDILKKQKDEILYSVNNAAEIIAAVPTDIGTPVVAYLSLPAIQKVKLSFHTDDLLKIKLESHTWNTQTYGIKILNPLMKWYGSRRYMQTDSRLAVNLQVELGNQSIKIKIDLQNDDFFGKGDIGFQSFVQSQIYIYDAETHTYEYYMPVTKDREHQKRIELLNLEIEEMGMIFNVTIFDCERNLSPSKLINMRNYITSTFNKNYGKKELLRYFLEARHLWAQTALSADPGMCGFGIQGKRNLEEVTGITIEMGYKLIDAEMTDDDVIMGTAAMNFKYNLENKENIVKGWSIEYLLKINGYSDNNYTILSTRHQQLDYEIFIREQEFGNNKVLYNVSITNHNSYEMMRMKISKISTKSQEQLNMHSIKYPECAGCGNLNKYPCLLARTSFLHENIEIKYSNINDSVKMYSEMMNDFMRTNYGNYLKKMPSEKQLKNGAISIKMTYNIETDDQDIYVEGPFPPYAYIGIPNSDKIFRPSPRSYPLESDGSIFDIVGLQFACEINRNYYINQFNEHIQHNLTDEYTLFIRDDYPEATISIKYVMGVMVVRFKVADNVLEVFQKNNKYKLEYNDEKKVTLKIDEIISNNIDYIEYETLVKEEQLLISAKLITDSVILYNKKQINIYSERDISALGLCYG